MSKQIAIWLPTVRTNTGTDIFAGRLVKGLNELGVKAEITWLPLRAEYAPWTAHVPKLPERETVVHVSTWLAAPTIYSQLTRLLWPRENWLRLMTLFLTVFWSISVLRMDSRKFGILLLG